MKKNVGTFFYKLSLEDMTLFGVKAIISVFCL